jgi:hypothetical protein
MMDISLNPLKYEEKINEAYILLQEGMPLSSVAQILDLSIKDIEYLYDYSD